MNCHGAPAEHHDRSVPPFSRRRVIVEGEDSAQSHDAVGVPHEAHSPNRCDVVEKLDARVLAGAPATSDSDLLHLTLLQPEQSDHEKQQEYGGIEHSNNDGDYDERCGDFGFRAAGDSAALRSWLSPLSFQPPTKATIF